jgi:lipoate---protein ligase
MRVIFNDSTNPYFNLAWEEYIFKHIACHEDILLIWQNSLSVVIGRNQNVWEEVNLGFANEHHIPVIRRISGGGAVYNDLGNLNFSIISNDFKESLSNYRKFTEPFIEALKELGVTATLHGKSDIYVDDAKISANTQSYYQNRMIHQGTLLFSTSMPTLFAVLKNDDPEVLSIAVKSERVKATNISSHLMEMVDLETFKQYLFRRLLKTEHLEQKAIRLLEHDYALIKEIEYDKYRTWEWNYGESPAFEIGKSFGKHRIRVKVDEGIIEEVEYYEGAKKVVLTVFTGMRYELSEMLSRMDEIDTQIRKPVEELLKRLL